MLDGSQAGDNANGLVLAGGSSGVHGVTITNFSGHGIVLNSEGNTVENNVIFGNAGDGVRSDGSVGNRILSNALAGNAGLAIDIGGAGPTPNDAGDADGIPNYPVITSVVRGSTTISGTIAGTPETTFLIQFFTDEECVESGRGEGASLVGSGSVSTDGSGEGVFEVVLEETLPKDLHVVATATSPLGTSEFSECGVQVTRIEHDPSEIVPESFRLGANYPNPFASETTIPFDVPAAGNVRVEIFNSLGQVVVVPVDRSLSPGSYRITVSAATLPSGVYYYRMRVSGMVLTGRMTVVK
jgi:parallel beta-helix repeat protein